MVNSGTFTSTENQNGIECLESSSTTPVSYKNDLEEAKNDDILPCQTASAIEPTIDCDKSNISKMDQEQDDDDDDDKQQRYNQQSRFFCSVPLDKVQTVLSTYSAAKPTPPPPQPPIKVKSVQRKVLCLFCDRTFVSDTLRQKHVERCHSPKQFRRVSLRKHQNQFTSTLCVYCDKLAGTNHTLPELFGHLVEKHSSKYFGCLVCQDRFLNRQQFAEHNNKVHNIPIIVDKQRIEEEIVKEQHQQNVQIEHSVSDAEEHKKKKIVRNGKKVKSSKVIVKRSKRLQAKGLPEAETTARPTKNRRGRNVENKETQSANNAMPVLSSTTATALATNANLHHAAPAPKQNNEKPLKTNSVNPYPEFDSFFQVKKITDHSIDNLKISSLTFDDVFDKAFFNRIQCNIQENLLNHIDGKLFKNEESESRISNFEKISTLHPTDTTLNISAENYGCELSLNAVTPTTSSLLSTQQFGEDPESQIEYGSKPSKKKALIKKDEVHYKYFTRRKYQAIILEQKENRDLSKLDMWTQLVIKNRQQKIVDDKKTAKEILDYFSGAEYKNKMQREELNRILDRRGPFEDLREEVSKRAALDKLNSKNEEIDVQEEVCELLNDLLNNVFEMIEESSAITCTSSGSSSSSSSRTTSEEHEEKCEIPGYLNLRRATASLRAHDGEIDKSDKIALICSSQETENFELPTNTVRRKNEKVELTGEWARSRIYVCAACGLKLQNMKQLLEHKSNVHQYVWVQHYEFVGNQSELYSHLSIPVLGKVGVLEENSPAGKMWRRSEARQCTKCAKQCNSLGELHRHILECGGDWTWMLARKKCKYRPFGAKSRRKRRGLVKRIYTQKTEPPEKKIYKKAVDGPPRQKPSDAETIQRMLANLPPKRATRKLISLKDGFNSNTGRNVQAKLKRGKLVRDEKKSSAAKDKELMPAPAPPPLALNEKSSSKKQMNSYRRSLRSLNKVLATRILETNSTLIIRRKYKTKLSEKAAVQQKNNSNKDSNKNEKRQKRMRSDSLKSAAVESKRSSPRKIQSSNDLVVSGKNLKDKMSIKRFFPVKKKQTVGGVENEEKTRVKRKIVNQLITNEVKKLKQQEKKRGKTRDDDEEMKTLRKRKTVVDDAAVESKKPDSRLRNKFRSVVNKIKKLNASEKEKSKDCHPEEEEKKILNDFLEKCDENPPILEPQVVSSEVKAKNDQVVEIQTEKNNEPLLLLSPSQQQQKKKIRKPTRGLNDCIAMLTNKLTKKSDEKEVEEHQAPTSHDVEKNSRGYILKVPLFNEHFRLKQPPAATSPEGEKEEEAIKTMESVKDSIWNCLIEKSEIKLKSPLNGLKKKKKKINKKLNELIQSNIDDFLIAPPAGTTTSETFVAVPCDKKDENKIEIISKDDIDEDEIPLSTFLKEPSSPQINIIDKPLCRNNVEEIIPDNNNDNDVQNVRIEQEKIDGLLGGNVDALIPSPKSADKCSNLDYFDKFPSTAIQGEPISFIENNKTVETSADVNNSAELDFTEQEEDTKESKMFSEKMVIDEEEEVRNKSTSLDVEENASSPSSSSLQMSEGEIKENLNGRRKTIRCAKAKAVENIHDDALSELTDNERNRKDFNDASSTASNSPGIESNFIKPAATTSTALKTTRKSLSKKRNSNAESLVLNESSENDEDVNNGSSNNVKELRRSGRNSRKIIYNEIDLVDPLIDELDSKMEKEIKNIQISSELVSVKSVDYHQHQHNSEPKLNSDELFDLLKATPNENIVLSKPTNSFLKNFDDLSDDGMNVVFNDILDKTSDIEDDLIDKTFPSLIIALESSDAKAKPPKIQKNNKKNKKQKKKNGGTLLKKKQAKLLGKEIETKLLNDSIPPLQVEDKRNSIEDNSMEPSTSLDNRNFCEICNKSFRRLEGLIKHKRTLTHISKLSELEAKEAALKQQEQVTLFSLAVENNSSLQLADIINDVLNKPASCEEENAEAKRYRSLGERKSFEQEAKIIETNKQISNTATAEKQITLLESIIENRLVEYSSNEDAADVSYEKSHVDIIEEKSISSLQNNEFVRPLQYEEISEDSNLKSFVDDQKARKVLNRDEELFLECCSLLKSGSEVSNFSKKSKELKLFQQQSSNNEDCWRPGSTCDNDSNSVLVNNFNARDASNWNNNSQIERDSSSFDEVSFHSSRNGSFPFDAFKLKSDGDIDDVQSNSFSYNSSRMSAECKTSGDLSDGSTDSKKMLTKGAMKVFEGLKVSIPTEELNLTKLLIPSSSHQSKQRQIPFAGERKSTSSLLVNANKCHDVYDFEETQDNSDIFNKPDFKSFRLKKIDSDNEASCDGMSSTTSCSLPETLPATTPTPNKTQENIITNKKKCMIMGRIFKNAAKSKIDQDIRNIPILDNNKLVEEFVKSCPAPVPPAAESPPPPKMTEEEMNVAFDKLVGNIATNKTSTPNPNCNNKRKVNKAKAKKRNLEESDGSSDDEFALKKSAKKRTKRKNTRPQDNSINLEQELKECIGVAGRKSQRKCTSGKQNVLIEYWSSDESLFETLLLENVVEPPPPSPPPPVMITEPALHQPVVISAAIVEQPPKLEQVVVEKKKSSSISGSSRRKVKGMGSSSSPRMKRAAANPLYHWSSSSEDESGDLIEVKPIRDEIDDDEDRPVQHGWIVGDSPKKLVTMLAQAKGKKCEIDGVKEQGKKRTNVFS